jgi:hypothetical protein
MENSFLLCAIVQRQSSKDYENLRLFPLIIHDVRRSAAKMQQALRGGAKEHPWFSSSELKNHGCVVTR